MTREQVESLHPGDLVFWNDPDEEICSRFYTIQSIELVDDNVVRITDVSGDELECYIDELA